MTEKEDKMEYRIREHPILGEIEETKKSEIYL